MITRSPISKDEPIVIVGAGVFGLSTALEVKKRGYQHVTVLDRYLPPVVDGSSVDISRVIRVDYADPLYGKMAGEAHEGWINEYGKHYHQTGFVMLAEGLNLAYIERSKQTSRQLDNTLQEYDDARQIRDIFPSIQAQLDGLKGYVNPQGGWADAEARIRQLSVQCTLRGVSFITGPRGRVLSLRYNGGRVAGVNVAEGDPILASQVILATGAWTNRLIPISHASSASGQPVGFIQLTKEEAEKLRDMPVIINLSTGVFIFPPTPETNVLKVARHSYGFATVVPVEETSRVVSSPKRDGNNAAASYLPADAEEGLRQGLGQLVPDFAQHEWMSRRLCWYSDTPEGDFIVDYHPEIAGLFLATGGAGHAFKFLPVLGKYIADCFENKASVDIRKKWRLRIADGSEEAPKMGDGSRGGPPLRTLTRSEQAKL
ncbi:FAD dependent oxidoreductase [Pleurostoma richardsiae]|uniref:FAD dependent oxidoreductase n=1 Tax=Pleurostoma richardsiae TaxID=41990 RepID=A0AA38RRQ2_9PEZI|nr:FAD dependent oxidoreductase [Pleurostoma richardsiae]